MKYLLSTLFLFPVFIGAVEYIDDEETDWSIALYYDREIKLTDKQRADLAWQMAEHIQKGYKYLMESEKKAWYIPNMTIRDITREAIKGAIATVGKAGCKGCTIAACLAVCAEAGAKLYEQYKEAQTLMEYSKHHFELADFIKEILNKDTLS